MNSLDSARRRMRNQHLWGPPLETPEDVVRWLGAVQAQEFPLAKWSVAQRADGVNDAVMNKVFADGGILRTHVLRPTWHFVVPADIRWLLGLTAPRVHALNAHYYRKMEIDDNLFAKSNALIAEALKGGVHLTRKEIAAALNDAGIVASGPRLAYLTMRAELDALICSGAPRGKQQTYALLEERAPCARTLGRDEALAELIRRYFTARGPATVKDFMWWSSLTSADARRGLEMVEPELEREVIDDRTYWFAPSSSDGSAPAPVIDLVQVYDESVMSYSESRDVLSGSWPADANPPEFLVHAMLLDGRLIGHWRRMPKANSAVIETFLYRPLSRVEKRALDAAVERHARFLGVPVDLV